MRGQRGFTLLEAMMAAGMSAAILVILYVAIGEGTDISRDVTKQQDAIRSVNNTLLKFSQDVRSAVYFYAGVTTGEDDEQILDDTPLPREITFAVGNSLGDYSWIKYELVTGILTGDTYLVRLSDLEDPTKLNLSYIAQDVADLEFRCYDKDMAETDRLTETVAIEMVIVIDSGVATREEKIFCRLRNENLGLRVPPWNFEEERDAQIIK